MTQISKWPIKNEAVSLVVFYSSRMSSLLGTNGLSLDRCNYDTIKRRRLDTSPRKACSSLLPHTWRLVVVLGRRNESKFNLIQNVSCFYISMKFFQVFEELLLDADWSVNAGMWMWLSCSSFFQQFFHCYCPVKFGRKADPNGDYIRYKYRI